MNDEERKTEGRDKEQLELLKRLNKEIAPFTLGDLPVKDDVAFADLYLYQKILGAGTYGVVVAAIDKAHLEQCAIKIISKDLTQEEELRRLNRESEILSRLDHPNVVKFLKLHESPYHFFIVMERLKGGSLADFVLYRKKKNNPLQEPECRAIMKQLLEGLAYLHSRSILHRDLKPANILMKSFHSIEKAVKIADFGLCHELNADSYGNPCERCGTRSYMAPEQIQGKSYYKGVDIWALGVIMYVLLTGKHPFYRKGDKTDKYLNNMRERSWHLRIACSKQAKDLLHKLCNPNALNRYSAQEALQHPWITGELDSEAPLTYLEEEYKFHLRSIFQATFMLSLCRLNEEEEMPRLHLPLKTPSQIFRATRGQSLSMQARRIVSPMKNRADLIIKRATVGQSKRKSEMSESPTKKYSGDYDSPEHARSRLEFGRKYQVTTKRRGQGYKEVANTTMSEFKSGSPIDKYAYRTACYSHQAASASKTAYQKYQARIVRNADSGLVGVRKARDRSHLYQSVCHDKMNHSLLPPVVATKQTSVASSASPVKKGLRRPTNTLYG